MDIFNRMPPGLLGGGQQMPTQGIGNVMGLNPVQLQKMYPVWQQQYTEAQTNGQAFPQFNEWIQMQHGGQMVSEGP